LAQVAHLLPLDGYDQTCIVVTNPGEANVSKQMDGDGGTVESFDQVLVIWKI